MIECVIESADQTLSMLVSPKMMADKQSKGVFLTTISFSADGECCRCSSYAYMLAVSKYPSTCKLML